MNIQHVYVFMCKPNVVAVLSDMLFLIQRLLCPALANFKIGNMWT